MTDLGKKHCKGCEGEVAPLTQEQSENLLKQLDGWQLDSNAKGLSKSFSFKNYYHTMAFVNAIAWMAHAENHHPDLEVSYNQCVVRYTTHAIKGLSENDFICAAKVDEILKQKNA